MKKSNKKLSKKWLAVFTVLTSVVIFETFKPLGETMHNMFGVFGDITGAALFFVWVYSGYKTFSPFFDTENYDDNF